MPGKLHKSNKVTKKVDDNYEILNDEAALLLNYTKQHAVHLKRLEKMTPGKLHK